MKRLSRQLVNVTDELYKTKNLNNDTVAEVIRVENELFGLSSKTVKYLNENISSIKERNYSRVGRWMSRSEFEKMQMSGRVLQGGGGQTFVSTNGSTDFKNVASPGSVYVEFDVPTSSLLKGGKDGWYKLIGPDANKSQQLMLEKQGGTQLPEVKNIAILDKKDGR